MELEEMIQTQYIVVFTQKQKQYVKKRLVQKIKILKSGMYNMAVRVAEFSTGGAKLERLLPKNQHTAFPLIVSTETINGRKLFAEIRYSKEIIEF